jgi:hypothetical protein
VKYLKQNLSKFNGRLTTWRKRRSCLWNWYWKALTEGIKAFEPGLLAKANRGLLYVDEVNLLDDHLVYFIDSAASGIR